MSMAYTRSARPAWLAALVLSLLAFAPGTASAAFVLDPATLQIGGTTSTGSDPVQIGSDGVVTVTQNSGGAPALNTPWQVILGIPNVTTTTPKITSVTSTNNSISPITFTNATSASATLVSGQEAYTVLNLGDGSNNSNNFTNWAAADLAINGLTAQSFGLFKYNITAALADKDTVTFHFSNLPVGTFVIAYGEETTPQGTKPYSTPFTEAGLTTGGGVTTTAVPEPSTLALTLSGVVGFGFAGVRRLRRRLVVAG